MKKTKSNRATAAAGRPGETITIEPQSRFKLRVIATHGRPGFQEANLCEAPDGSKRFFLRDGYGVRRLSLQQTADWIARGLCQGPKEASLQWDPDALRHCLKWIGARANDAARADGDAAREVACINAGVIPPEVTWTGEPEAGTVTREFEISIEAADLMEKACAEHNIPIQYFVEESIRCMCNGMNDGEVVSGLKSDWRKARERWKAEVRSGKGRTAR